jgi:osmotically-inducible protein OsmY
VSFIGDTAYLIGDVKTEDERFRAEQAARTIPEVERIYNGVWVNP